MHYSHKAATGADTLQLRGCWAAAITGSSPSLGVDWVQAISAVSLTCVVQLNRCWPRGLCVTTPGILPVCGWISAFG